MKDGPARARPSARRRSEATRTSADTPRPDEAQPGSFEPSESDLAELAARRDALQQAVGLPGAQLKPILDAVFAELDGAIDALTQRQTASAARRAEARSEPARAERAMLRAVFAEAPVPLFLLERDGTVRRVNNRASDIIGSRPAYAAGKPFTLFVDLPSRAAVQTFLAAAVRTGRARQTECGLLGAARRRGRPADRRADQPARRFRRPAGRGELRERAGGRCGPACRPSRARGPAACSAGGPARSSPRGEAGPAACGEPGSASGRRGP